jgi:deazaflavin-dependent oxidoreductase (nitroreductase family)
VSALANLAKRLGGQRWFAAVGRKFVPVDRFLAKVTQGRFVTGGLRDLPCLLLTTTGRTSGKPRSNPLLYAMDGDAYIVIGSNWGGEHHPAWSYNLLAHPEATVTLDGHHTSVRAGLVTGAERSRLRGQLLDIWPGYAEYERRAPHRTLRIFRLERSVVPPAR